MNNQIPINSIKVDPALATATLEQQRERRRNANSRSIDPLFVVPIDLSKIRLRSNTAEKPPAPKALSSQQ